MPPSSSKILNLAFVNPRWVITHWLMTRTCSFLGPSKMAAAAIFWLNFLNNRSSIQSLFEISGYMGTLWLDLAKLKQEEKETQRKFSKTNHLYISLFFSFFFNLFFSLSCSFWSQLDGMYASFAFLFLYKEKETQEKLSKTNCSKFYVFFIFLFSLSWKFWPQLAREYASFASLLFLMYDLILEQGKMKSSSYGLLTELAL